MRRLLLLPLVALLVACGGSSSFVLGADSVAFVRVRDNREAVYVVNVDRGGVERLSERTDAGQGRFTSSPAWSPDGRRLAFASNMDGPYRIYVMDPRSGRSRPLIEGTSPAWSPDGRRLAFERGAGTKADLWVIGVDGRGLRRLTRNPGVELGPSWSPDGSKIAFSRRTADIASIVVASADGGGERRLTRGAMDELSPAWSPDGSKIAFSGRVASQWDIYVVDADGSGLRNLTRSPGDELDPSWSPNGRRIAFASDGAILVMDADGRNRRQVTEPENDTDPAWRPSR
jgi:Tol biopolymer transport system component